MPSMPSPSATRRVVCLGLAAAVLHPVRAAASEADGWITLQATRRSLKLRPDAASEADLFTFGDRAPGPAIRVKGGEPLRLRLRNGLDRPVSFHLHGWRGPQAQDGVGGLTEEPIPPGGSRDLAVNDPTPGTYLLRPIVLGGSAELAERGLSAMVIVEERKPPAVDREEELVIDDWRLSPEGGLAPFGDVTEAATGGRLGNWLTVNGAPLPRRVEAPPGARVRLRLVNAANARIMPIRFEGLKAYVAAIDSIPTDTFEPLRATLPFPPGRRYDLVVELPSDAGATGSVVAAVGPGVPLATFAVAGTAASARAPLAGIAERPNLPPEIRLQNAVRRDLAIAGGAQRQPDGAARYNGDPKRIWSINGAFGTPGMPPLISVARGTPVTLAITNNTPGVQALHLHGHAVRLLHNLDDGWEPYWIDTLQIPEGRTSRIAFIADNPGRWLLGSTVLERLDTGLWTWIEVT